MEHANKPNTRHKTIEFGTIEYWEKSYKDNPMKMYDWLEKYNDIKHLINSSVKKTDKILMVGCGNSLLSKDMFDDGYSNITNTDLSVNCIEQMIELHKECKGMIWEVCDVRDMSKYMDDSFDVIIDKGTLDALCCGDDAHRDTCMMMHEMYRLLKQGGKYLCISFAPKNRRINSIDYKFAPFDIDIQQIHPDLTNPHYMYLCVRSSHNKIDTTLYNQILSYPTTS